jgi:hypothetical protein
MIAEAAQAREVSKGVELSLIRRAAGASGAALSEAALSEAALSEAALSEAALSGTGLPGEAVLSGTALPGEAVLSRAALPGEAVLSDEAVLPVLPALRGLFPGGALQRGSVVAAGPWSLLCLALAAGASAAGAWCAVVGLPQLGVAAAAAVGLDPDRLLLIADPGTGWPQVVASLLDGCELVLLRPPGRPPAQVRRRIEATVRRFGGVLAVAGEWDGAQTRLSIAQQEWTGIGTGHGRLRARRVQVVADGRGGAAQPRSQWLWLPGPDGSVTAADQAKAARDPFWPAIRSTG